MDTRLESLAHSIRLTYGRLREQALYAREKNPSMILKAGRAPLSLSACAVDGGLLSQRMHGADIVLVRAVGVNFIYEDSRLKSHAYLPQKSPEPSIEIKNSLDEHEAAVFRSLIRLKYELDCAISCVEKFSPDMLLLDGSLLPLPSDRPPEKSELHQLYLEVIGLYQKLREKDCILCGVIKDSRSRKLADSLGANSSDTLLCSFMLEEGERTEALPYSESKDALTENVKAFYIKPSRNDLPLRIETTSKNIEEVSGLVNSLSAISDSFAYPAILVEADMCAALDGSEMEPIEASLQSISGMKPLRRNSRPFR